MAVEFEFRSGAIAYVPEHDDARIGTDYKLEGVGGRPTDISDGLGSALKLPEALGGQGGSFACQSPQTPCFAAAIV